MDDKRKLQFDRVVENFGTEEDKKRYHELMGTECGQALVGVWDALVKAEKENPEQFKKAFNLPS